MSETEEFTPETSWAMERETEAVWETRSLASFTPALAWAMLEATSLVTAAL